MAENVLARILDGIATLKRGELDAVKNAVKERREVLKQQVLPLMFLSDEEKDALAMGNSEAIIRANEKLYDYSRVAKKELPKAKEWFKAPKPSTAKGDTEHMAAYYQWRLWNADGWARYKGGVIIEKATGKSVSSPHGEEEEEEEEEQQQQEEVVVDEAGAAMAAVRLE